MYYILEMGLSSKTTNALLWLVWAFMITAWPVQANGPARLYLQDVPIQDEKLLVVTVLIADVADLYGAEIQLHYDPARLRVRDENPRLAGIQIAPGPLLAFDNRFVATNNVETQAGLINFVFTLIKPALPISGEGALATVVFEVAGDGPYTIEIAKATFVSSELEAVPVTTSHLTLNGPEEAAAPAEPAQSEPGATRLPGWGWGLAVLALVTLLILLQPTWAALTAKPSTQPASRRIPGSTRASPRSALLLTEQGEQAWQQGNHQRAYELFSRAIELDPANAAAWLGKGLVAEQETEKRICFQRVLALDPANEAARAELQKMGT
jgi:hypothetical protein